MCVRLNHTTLMAPLMNRPINIKPYYVISIHVNICPGQNNVLPKCAQMCTLLKLNRELLGNPNQIQPYVLLDKWIQWYSRDCWCWLELKVYDFVIGILVITIHVLYLKRCSPDALHEFPLKLVQRHVCLISVSVNNARTNWIGLKYISPFRMSWLSTL